MGAEWLAILMFAIFLVLLLVGYPVAFSFAGTAIVFGAIGILLGEFDFNRLIILFSRWFKTVDNFTLLAVPFFVFMGAILEKSGLAERMLTTIGMALGRLKGGLGLTVVVVGAMLAAATGVVAATVIVMGLLSLPTMVRYGYDHRLATGLITASGTLAQLLPPSLVLILLAQVVGVSVPRPVPGSDDPGHDAGRDLRHLLPVPRLYRGGCGTRPSGRGPHHPRVESRQGTACCRVSDHPG